MQEQNSYILYKKTEPEFLRTSQRKNIYLKKLIQIYVKQFIFTDIANHLGNQQTNRALCLEITVPNPSHTHCRSQLKATPNRKAIQLDTQIRSTKPTKPKKRLLHYKAVLNITVDVADSKQLTQHQFLNDPYL